VDDTSLVVTVHEAANLLGISRGLAYQLVREGVAGGTGRSPSDRGYLGRSVPTEVGILTWIRHSHG
jgi:hypothetical protein